MLGSILISAGLIQSIFLGFYFGLQEKSKNISSRYLGFFFLFLAMFMACNLVYFTGNIIEYPHLMKVGYLFGFCIAPSFSVSVVRYFGIPKEKAIWNPIYLIVPIQFLLYETPFYLSNAEDKIKILSDIATNDFFSELNIIQMMILGYSFCIFLRLYFRFQIEMKHFAKDIHWEGKIFYQYLLYLIIWLLFCILVCVILPGKISETISNLGISIWILGFAWHRIYLDKNIMNHLQIQKQDPSKYQKSYIPEKQMLELGKHLETIVNNKDYLFNGDLNLANIANTLGLSNHSTSQVCNRFFGKSLIDVIQEKRIEHAKIALLDTKKTVLRIGFDVGFNSKNSFIRAFKEVTKLTPTEYRNQNKS